MGAARRSRSRASSKPTRAHSGSQCIQYGPFMQVRMAHLCLIIIVRVRLALSLTRAHSHSGRARPLSFRQCFVVREKAAGGVWHMDNCDERLCHSHSSVYLSVHLTRSLKRLAAAAATEINRRNRCGPMQTLRNSLIYDGRANSFWLIVCESVRLVCQEARDSFVCAREKETASAIARNTFFVCPFAHSANVTSARASSSNNNNGQI